MAQHSVLVFFLSGIHWITYSLTFDESFKILIPIALICIPLFLSLFFSLFTLIIGPFLSFNFSSLLLFSGGLAFFDFLRAKILTGFPWNLWAYSFSWATEIIQIVNKLGFFGFNLICITVFTIPVVVLFKQKTFQKFLFLSFIPLFFISLFIYGNHSINQNNKKISLIDKKYNIKVISPNFELQYGLSEEEIKTRLKKLVRYSDPNKNIKTLFVWPEGVFSGYSFNDILILKDTFTKSFNKNHLIVFGINRNNEKKNGFFNSLIIVNNRMEIIEEYKKQKLVPFGEFLPLENLLSQFGLKKITEGYGSFLKGNNQKNLITDELNILPLICYEIIFPKLTQLSDPSTNLIVNISEDGWFGNTIGPYQHFAKSVFRSIEQNTFLVRSANKGISAIINNKGEILKSLNPKESGNIEIQMPLFKNENKNKNDLIFFILLITYILPFIIKKNNEK